uniref:HTH psq-type domain-containing protein n=1 Tax=Rhabditophanes sp. KR3021 TaxID=114890 RepID=A0AC35U6T2_9BILA
MNKVLKEKKVEEPLDLSTKSPVSFDPLENAMAFYRQLTGNSCDHFVSQLPIFTPPKLVNEGKPKTRQPATRAHLVKKAYTQENLEAAVDDIRTKKLGTRKASVVYGIPRSTLRNKIYKLETELAAKGMLDPESTSIIMRRKRQKVANQISQNSIESKPLCKNNSFENKRKTCSLETLANVVLSQSYHLDAPLRVMEMDGKSDYSPPSLLTNECDDSLSPSIKFSRESSTGKTMSNVSDSCMTTLEEFEGSLNKDKKKSRPKRGNYRRYNKDALDEAVKSVRLGEMSVHRAGSYFGVPHSTLEYKVKERKTKRSLKKCQGSEDDTNSFDGEKNEEEEDDGIFEVDELDFRLTPSKNERSLSLIHENLLIEY